MIQNATKSLYFWATGEQLSEFEDAQNVWNSFFYTNTNETVRLGPLMKPAGFDHADLLIKPEYLGAITGLLIAFFVKQKVVVLQEFLEHHKIDKFKHLKQLLCFLLWIVTMPLAIVAATYFKLIKRRAEKILKAKHGVHFKGFLEGPDTVWACERPRARSVINIISYLSVPREQYEPMRTSGKILHSLRQRISGALMEGQQPHPKMFYRKMNELGYFFWSDEAPCKIEKYIRHMDFYSETREFLTEDDLKQYTTEKCNAPLPENHSRTWEMLVSKQPIMRDDGNGFYYPILFRVHHCLGDGVALLRLLLESMADKSVNAKLLWTSGAVKAEKPEKSAFFETFKTISQALTMQNLQKTYEKFIQVAYLVYVTPFVLCNITFSLSPDSNILHPDEIHGEKVVNWIHEASLNFPLLETIKRIKKRTPGARFSDVISTILSKSLSKYFRSHGQLVPERITMVVPARIEREQATLSLKNRFSVAMRPLPLKMNEARTNPVTNFYETMLNMKVFSDVLATAPDYQVNYWIMSFVAEMLPDYLFAKLMSSSHSTLAFSNLPGPQESVQIQGYALERIGFFLPNFGQTTVGITILSYGGQLQLGIMADKNAIPSKEEAGQILKDMVAEVANIRQFLLK
ncbi:uncharacterized protein LOC134828138 [Culicoides brevitarsis]|uniref:uncharacterized protein LOC134828138 n=1 Tax=Culicoides brevitarsis TaxID=469753 RepID=UPI00307CA63A